MTNYFKDKRVLITGGAGFLASHLVPKLVEAGATVGLFDNQSRGDIMRRDQGHDCWWVRLPIEQRELYVSPKFGDVTNIDNCTNVMDGFDIVFNLAAWVAGVIYNQKNHSEMYIKNHALQAVPLQAAINVGVERFVQVSTACVYSPEHNHPSIEENGHVGEPVAANIGYSLAKRAGERMAVWAYQEFGLETVIVRPTNLFGERDYFDNRSHVIPALIKKCYEQDPIQFYGTGEEVREFLYAGDCADGLMAAAEFGRPGEAYNLGTAGETAVSISQLFDMIKLLTGNDHKDVETVKSHDPGDPGRWSDGTKANVELGWVGKTTLLDGLTKTIEWYNAQLKPAEVAQMLLKKHKDGVQ